MISPANLFADNPPNEPKEKGVLGSIQKLDDVRSSVDLQEIPGDNGLNPTMTFEEGCSRDNAMSSTSTLTTPYQIPRGAWSVIWGCSAVLC